MRGDMDRYLELTSHVRGFTLAQPFGGPAVSFEDRSESLREAASYFQRGDAKIELTAAHAWGDTIVLVMIERQHGEVGGLPDQEWPLRVTQVYRREEGEWRMVHRHADLLVEPIELAQASALARGELSTQFSASPTAPLRRAPEGVRMPNIRSKLITFTAIGAAALGGAAIANAASSGDSTGPRPGLRAVSISSTRPRAATRSTARPRRCSPATSRPR